jgi:arsenate reductase
VDQRYRNLLALQSSAHTNVLTRIDMEVGCSRLYRSASKCRPIGLGRVLLKGGYPMINKPSVLFVCVHNAGRSQMAAAYLAHLAGDRIEVRSAGSTPADNVNVAVVEAMAEDGIDISSKLPKVLTEEAVKESDVVITMGCGDACPIFPGKRYEDWALADPAGQGVAAVRPIRDDIKRRIQALIAELIDDNTNQSI